MTRPHSDPSNILTYGITVPEVGLELRSRPLQTLESPENLRSPEQYTGCRTRSVAKVVDNIHNLLHSLCRMIRGLNIRRFFACRKAWTNKLWTHPSVSALAAYAMAWSRTCRM